VRALSKFLKLFGQLILIELDFVAGILVTAAAPGRSAFRSPPAAGHRPGRVLLNIVVLRVLPSSF
jgi:hypothetical protein